MVSRLGNWFVDRVDIHEVRIGTYQLSKRGRRTRKTSALNHSREGVRDQGGQLAAQSHLVGGQGVELEVRGREVQAAISEVGNLQDVVEHRPNGSGQQAD